MTITTRAGKGSALTHSELDGNFTDLDSRTKTGWADIVSELYIRGGPSAPTVTQFKGGIYLYEFMPADTLDVFSNFHIPHTWKVGTMLYPHFHFTTTSNASGVVRIGFEYTKANRRETGVTGYTFGATQTISVDFTIASNSADSHFVCEAPNLGGIDGTGLDIDGMVLMRIFREGAHANDTFPDSIWGITADLHIEVAQFATPYRAPDFFTGL